jgi:hypothetical protein
MTIFKQYKSNIITATILGLLISAPHAVFLLLIIWFFLIFNGLIMTVKAWKNNELIKPLLIKSSIWILMSVLVISWHFHMYYSKQEMAQQIIDKIEFFHVSNGIYPLSLSEVGVSEKEIKEKFDLSGYINKDEYTAFSYASTYIIYEFEYYDFKSKKWTHND